ncbi:helix-turn-helix domain-containing protein [Rhizobium rhizogenes]|uniref:helix-turn-helix domain-containing protein n=1 Tax=Rhizobium rhizogenes TaxID=359 RepID=UPI001574EA42|nr:helix-turn-helix transcriptional regulator [Rhizobium rhizogenes]
MELVEYRQMAGVTQEVMARHMGLPLRTYENIEAGRVEFRPVHANAARWALVEITVAHDDARWLPQGIADRIMDAAKLIDKEKGGH